MTLYGQSAIMLVTQLNAQRCTNRLRRRLLHLEQQGLGEVGVRSVIYFVRASVANAQLIADQVKELNRCSRHAAIV